MTSSEQPEKLDLRSHDIAADKQAALRAAFPEVFTEGGKIDFERLKAALGETVDARVVRREIVEVELATGDPNLGDLLDGDRNGDDHSAELHTHETERDEPSTQSVIQRPRQCADEDEMSDLVAARVFLDPIKEPAGFA